MSKGKISETRHSTMRLQIGPNPPGPASIGGEYKAGLDLAIAKGWLVRHESGTYVRFTGGGGALFPPRGGSEGGGLGKNLRPRRATGGLPTRVVAG